jgi:hypothetical protein
MKRPNLLFAGCAAALILLPAPACARGYYFNRPGVSRDAYMADVAECIELAGGVRPGNQYIPYSPSLIATGVVAFFAGMARSRERRRLGSMVERTCMADKGYRRYEVEDEVLDEIEDLHSAEARADRLFGLAASEAPIGRRAPE